MNIKILKTQSILQEALQEALYMLDDTRLNTLNITRVKCSNGKEFAKVYLDPAPIQKEKKEAILKMLKKANNTIRQYLQTSLSWYKTPQLSYEFDNSLENINKLESIFKQIKQKQENKGENRNKK
ncbi:30S ribosome-binding factor RbfA [Helicobacter sp. MIT 14-3879]|uniref:30S ribosome-binding factor RbfA n=1 Tax=Helicobacter sp. MIT 14-3879 TaxID=2040649 RepID=UPI000E1F78D8|nr:30S ribosome-binding factor RbfA [Helicobacter sp. MIT 14-3879]RDU65611.1 30S ribosome-binding factor RbfA [Helicobacter sp. MIT 14-3879]